MRVRITIDCDNAAFEGDPGPELARILRELADDCAEGMPRYFDEPRDVNGNKVGKVDISD